jgi:hypothetical protein
MQAQRKQLTTGKKKQSMQRKNIYKCKEKQKEEE